MQIYVRMYNAPMIGNYSTDPIAIPSNKILVSDLKQILFEKYSIEKSLQRLTFKYGNYSLITLTNEFPLFYFFIKDKSIIYLEVIQTQTKAEEISRKLSLTKSKYLKTLGLFRHFTPPPMGTIVESQNEYIIDENGKDVNKKSMNGTDIAELISAAIKSGNYVQFREVMEQYDDNNNYKVDAKWNTGWAPIHYASFYGYVEICDDLINKYKCDVNLITDDNWTALHLAAFKGHFHIVQLLISSPNIDVNKVLPKIGTALHCACKKNNLKIASLLLHKADPRIKDMEGFDAISLTSDKNIKLLIERILYPKRKDINRRGNSSSEADEMIKKFSFIPKQPKTIGYVDKMGVFMINYNRRFIEVDPFVGCFRRYQSMADYPKNPIETIPLIDIVSCKESDSWFSSGTHFYFELLYKQRQLYRFNSKKVCDKWIETITNAVIYSKLSHNFQERNSKITEYLLKQEGATVLIDFETGEVHSVNVEELKHDKNKQKTPNFNQTPFEETHEPKQTTSDDQKQQRKKRRPNPFTQPEKEEKLFEDSTLTKGISYESFEILDCLGAGTFGKVFKVENKVDKEIFAMKVINKKYLIRNQQLRYAVTECNVLKAAQSPFIITLHYAFQTPDNLYMIIDYCPGGDLNYHILQNLFEEEEAKFFIAELVLGIEHLHSLDIIYRDLKPENILIAKDGHIKLADFGLAKENVGDSTTTKSFCGSPAYLAPEMLTRKGVGKSADIYGIGAVLYEMMCGSPPFYANDMNTMYRNISGGNLMLHDYFSEELKDLLSKLLNKDPKHRIGVVDKGEIKRHPFFSDIDWDKLARKEIKPPIDLVEIKREIDMEMTQEYKDVKFQDKDYNESNKDYNRVKKFTFVRPHSPKTSKDISEK